MRRLGIYYRTARHLKPRQVIHRWRVELEARLLSSRRTPNLSRFSSYAVDREISLDVLLSRRDSQACIQRADLVVSGRFEFVGEVAKGWPEVDWVGSGQGRLWRFQLQSFEYAYDLGVAYQETHDSTYFVCFRDLVQGWLEAHVLVAGDGWHPYPTSVRVVNWVLASQLFRVALEEDVTFRSLLLAAIHQQGGYLAKHLEYDLMANHLFKNIKALLIVGASLRGRRASGWKSKAVRLLKAQLDEQILSDGGHFERSPTYHCQVLEDVLDCLAFLPPEEEELRELLATKARAMLRFIESLQSRDGTYPLFNDSPTDLAPSPAELRWYANRLLDDLSAGTKPLEASTDRPRVVHHEASGYVVMETPESRLVLDVGKFGPDYQLGHAHCDLFSFELSVGGHKVIVDSGTPTYAEGELRTACRSTRAHNTVVVDGEEQAEIWKSFRVGRRPRPGNVRLVQREGLVYCEGWHNGYRHLPGRPAHRRVVFLVRGTYWVVLDEISGRKTHKAASYLHLHPAVALGEGAKTLCVGEQCVHLVAMQVGQAELATEEGFYAPRIASIQKSAVLRLETRGACPLFTGYALASSRVGIEKLVLENPTRVVITRAEGRDALNRSGGTWRVEKYG